MPAHFYVDLSPAPQPAPGTVCHLNPERSNYLCRVMRMRGGQLVTCMDGAGHGFTARLAVADPKRAQLEITEVQARAAPAAHRLGLALSLVKGQAMDRAIQLATELGASNIFLFSSAHSNAKLTAQRSANRMQHWQKIAISASEQCGRLYLPELHLSNLPDLLAADTDNMAFQPGADVLPQNLPAADRTLLVGPEGGWSAAELALFERNNCPLYGLGNLILRAETVPAVALALVRQAMGEFH